MRILWGLFRAEESEEERKRRQNAALDRKIAGKELEIRMLRGLLRERKEKRFNRRMERRRSTVSMGSESDCVLPRPNSMLPV